LTGQPEEEATMRRTIGGVTIAVLLGTIIIVMGSCQQTVANDKPQTVEITFDAETQMWKVPPVRVHRRGQVVFKAGDTSVWLLFPGDFEYVQGKGTFCQTDGLLAVSIPRDGLAIIEVPEWFPNPDVDQEVFYSVMLRLKSGEGTYDWQYAHGENPPPRIIIPKR
jgi:hypothetical protein